MQGQQTLTIPTKQPTRTEIFAFRCTTEEREAIFAFAQQLDLPVSQVVRHYLLQAAAQYDAQQVQEVLNAACHDPIEQPEEPMNQAEGIDLVAAYQTILRTLARLESEEYTSDNEQQADVWGHDDLPDPASDSGTRQG